jgi:hypothetical protein
VTEIYNYYLMLRTYRLVEAGEGRGMRPQASTQMYSGEPAGKGVKEKGLINLFFELHWNCGFLVLLRNISYY